MTVSPQQAATGIADIHHHDNGDDRVVQPAGAAGFWSKLVLGGRQQRKLKTAKRKTTIPQNKLQQDRKHEQQQSAEVVAASSTLVILSAGGAGAGGSAARGGGAVDADDGGGDGGKWSTVARRGAGHDPAGHDRAPPWTHPSAHDAHLMAVTTPEASELHNLQLAVERLWTLDTAARLIPGEQYEIALQVVKIAFRAID